MWVLQNPTYAGSFRARKLSEESASVERTFNGRRNQGNPAGFPFRESGFFYFRHALQASMATSTSAATGRRDIDLDRVRAAVQPILVSHGVVLVDVEWLSGNADAANGNATLRVTIEQPGSDEVGGGVNLDDCAEVSRDVSQALDVEDFIRPRYSLEVSSPGLDRPLLKLSDFQRFEGKLAKVKLSQPAPDGQRVLRGTLVSPAPQKPAEGDSVDERIAVAVDGRTIEVPFADVSAAHLVFEVSSQPKRPKSKPSKSNPGKRTPSAVHAKQSKR